MRVLVTGAAGNLGSETLPLLLAAGHEVRALERDTPITRAVLSEFPRVEAHFGDLAAREDVRRALEGVDAVVHDAFVLPPASERAPEQAHAVNVEGMRHLIALAHPAARIVFASSIAAYGITQAPFARGASEQHYAEHKRACEALLAASGLPHVILRIAVAPPRRPRTGDPELLRVMFARAAESRVEFVDPRDVATAQANALTCHEALGRTLALGGGPRCQMRHAQLVNGVFESLGLGAMPREAFGDEPMPGDHLDTRESQRLLRYQTHDFEDYLRDLREHAGLKRFGAMLLRPLARRFVLRYRATSGPTRT